MEKVARNQLAAYLKILTLLVPREMKGEHSGGVKAMTDEQIEAARGAARGRGGSGLAGAATRCFDPRSCRRFFRASLGVR
jgi:hypothetical protein